MKTQSHIASNMAAVSNNDTFKEVSAATTLTSTDTYVVATIPAGAADTYAITLPAAGSCPAGHEIAIYAIRGGSWTDGQVTIVGSGTADGFTTITVDKTKSLVVLRDIAQRHWVPIGEQIAGAHGMEGTLDFTT